MTQFLQIECGKCGCKYFPQHNGCPQCGYGALKYTQSNKTWVDNYQNSPVLHEN
jgi:uncharacterized OB-fold protein